MATRWRCSNFPEACRRPSWPAASDFPRATSLSGSIEDSFRRRLAALPEPTQRLLLLAAADATGNSALVWRAAAELLIPAEAAFPAIQAGLADFGARIRFRHPLVRSAAYWSAGADDRQGVHRALADVTDPELDPDRRAWHLAQATVGLDDPVADELERSAERAQSRGGVAAAAAFLYRATQLTVDPESRAQRALAAAEANHLAGAQDVALELLTIAEAGPLHDLQRAQADRLRAGIAYLGQGGLEAPRLLVRAAERLESLDVRAARDTLLDALIAAGFAGRLAEPGSLQATATRTRRGPRHGGPSTAADLFLDGMATALIDGYSVGAPTLKLAVKASLSPASRCRRSCVGFGRHPTRRCRSGTILRTISYRRAMSP